MSKVDMDGFALRYLLIKYIRTLDRAVFDTVRTTGALALDDIPGLFNQCDPEVSPPTFDPVNFGVAQDLDVGMPADLDQFGR